MGKEIKLMATLYTPAFRAGFFILVLDLFLWAIK